LQAQIQLAAHPSTRIAWARVLASAAVVAAGSLLAVLAFVSFTTIVGEGNFGDDYDFYSDIGARWLAGVPYYLPSQFDPHDFINMGDNLYPPSALPLFVGSAVLPPIVWWAVPIAVLAYAIVGWRPGPWTVAAMLLLLAWPRAHGSFLWGNTDMWMAAGVAAGLRWGWPAVALTLKPSLAFFALAGVRRRSFWLAALAMAAFVALTLPMWLDYIAVMRNTRLPLDYSVRSIPLLLVPLCAWFARPDRPALLASRRVIELPGLRRPEWRTQAPASQR
jgi:hypothetical protein